MYELCLISWSLGVWRYLKECSDRKTYAETHRLTSSWPDYQPGALLYFTVLVLPLSAMCLWPVYEYIDSGFLMCIGFTLYYRAHLN